MPLLLWLGLAAAACASKRVDLVETQAARLITSPTETHRLEHVGLSADAGDALPSVSPAEVLDLEGNRFTVPAPGKVTVLVFLAPNCPACEKTVADLDRYWRRFDPEQAMIMGVVLESDQGAAVQLKKRKGVDFPWTRGVLSGAILSSGRPPPEAKTLSDLYRVRGVPSIFVINDTGDVQLRVNGAPGDSEKVLVGVRALLVP